MSAQIKEKLVEFNDVTYEYMPGSVFSTVALNKINLEIDYGEFIGIIGHTGSGKTTLIEHINALFKPMSGTVKVKGIDTNEDKNKLQELRKSVGLVFQYPEYQLFEESVIKDIAYGPKNLKLDSIDIDNRVHLAMDQVGLDYDEIGEKSPFELSGGQRRRVAFAGVLAMEPDVLILDEPTAGLDPKGRTDVLNLLIRLKKQRNMSIIMISHYMDEIASVSSRVIVMDNGNIAMDGTPKEIFTRYDELNVLGLDVPYTVKLQNALSKLGIEFDDCILSLEEMRDKIKSYISDDKEGEDA